MLIRFTALVFSTVIGANHRSVVGRHGAHTFHIGHHVMPGRSNRHEHFRYPIDLKRKH
ncbi:MULTISPECIES: hypothetical protein [Pseudomonadaceae]|jgi:hypothetical protein|uniref:Uncharacterized protein n=1 Tax=Stutzerimonas chloritidismutans TaxID=203192 RepID=A0ABU9M570_STUCH|nr:MULTISPECIES: hypothetical protein [Pseudomonadaceae]MBC7197607.1 hypothetical protein [Stutzerimonas balearica]MDL0439119.1 hypothetical protein [Stutzerimonas frequens]UNG18049.1 hypothetical protein MKP10_20015 [Stutzerimonas zhaodongensis]UNG19408.1 hypothetical protein MKP10_03910 [Stutzerimonas zhaodongensis]|tara:strand:+ start:5663 stop:5836 length:174 start_codon:yes stop_codon:yes gene_type:complete